MTPTMSDATLKWNIYRKEILSYISTMTIKFSLFNDFMKDRQYLVLGSPVLSDYESPYYLNLIGEYNAINSPMYVYTVEDNTKVLFDKKLWTTYPATAEYYFYGSPSYIRLCKQYPNQVGLIKQIVYPIPSIEEAIEADDFTILRHEPRFLKPNEQDTLFSATKEIIQYVTERWFVYDYKVEDQYPLVFMSQLYLCLFQGLLKARVENMDTSAVHELHVWDRLEANGLLPYESILNDTQARWFYRNMEYLKENRGRKSNLILLAENVLKDLKVHLVGKRIFENTEDVTGDCLMVPEFLSDDIVDYSSKLTSSISPSTAAMTEQQFMQAYTGPSNSSIGLVDISSHETMDHILARIHEEGYYPKYSLEDSEEMEKTFGRSIVTNMPTRLLELLKYVIHTPYARLMASFCFDTMMYHRFLGHLDYRIGFIDQNTGYLVNIKARDAIIFLSYCMYRRFYSDPAKFNDSEISIPQYVEINKAYLHTRPRESDLPRTYYHNHFNYYIDTIIKTTQLLDDIPWMGNKIYRSAESFVQAVGKQYAARIKHTRELYMEMHPAHQWAMCYYYNHIQVHGRYTLEESPISYKAWIESTEGVADVVHAYDEFEDPRGYYEQLADVLLAKLMPIETSPDLAAYVGAIYDNTKYYTELKHLFQEWTGHYLTYLDTERQDMTYLEMQPTVVETGDQTYESETQMNRPGTIIAETHMEESVPYDFSTRETIPYLYDIGQVEETEQAYQLYTEVHTDNLRECTEKIITEHSLKLDCQQYTDTIQSIQLNCGCALVSATELS